MKLRTKTDSSDSFESKEFIWDMPGNTEVHGYVRPVLETWIKDFSAAHLLDIGCGNGALTAQLAANCARCVGLDHSATGVSMAALHHPHIEFKQCGTADPLPTELVASFDTVISVEVVEHLLLPRTLFAQARAALKPDGVFIVTTPFHGYWKNLALAVVGKYDAHWHPLRDYGHIKFFSEKTLRLLFEESGFKVERFERVGRLPIFARSMLMAGRLVK
jgi:2-polyprenyl-3-methyl-5-hydroxy-6-metoxy-1,4-benzoquinol methylase